jgi:hypothetical protein
MKWMLLGIKIHIIIYLLWYVLPYNINTSKHGTYFRLNHYVRRERTLAIFFSSCNGTVNGFSPNWCKKTRYRWFQLVTLILRNVYKYRFKIVRFCRLRSQWAWLLASSFCHLSNSKFGQDSVMWYKEFKIVSLDLSPTANVRTKFNQFPSSHLVMKLVRNVISSEGGTLGWARFFCLG